MDDYSFWRVVRFFIPLALQAMSQCLTYPLVAAVVSADGPTGFIQLTALAQGHNAMFLLGSVGFGLVTTGMIYAKDQLGARQFLRVNIGLALIVVVLHILVSTPRLGTFVFQNILGLRADMALIARKTLLISAIPQFCFFCRNVPLVQLLNARKSVAANMATLTRLILTLALIPILIHLNCTGWVWGNIAFAVPVAVELILSCYFARNLVHNLPVQAPSNSGPIEQLLFTLPVSLGGLFITGSALLISSFITRTVDSFVMLAVHTVAVGILSPVCMAAIRFQAVTIAFPPRGSHDHRLFRCALILGGFLSLLPLAFALIPLLRDWYFIQVQHLPSGAIPLAKWAVLLVCFLPPIQALRGHAEGLAALQKRPAVILCGQSVYMAALASACHIQVLLGFCGALLGVIAIFFGQFMAFFTIRLSLWTTALEQRQAPHEPNHLHC